MGFGKNPHVAKAESAEQRAAEARDELAREQAWLEAARRWERAAEREEDQKRRALYMHKSEAARAHAAKHSRTPSAPAKNERLELGRAMLSSRPKPKDGLLN